MSVDLVLVSTPEEVQESLASFNREAKSYPARSRSLLRQTRYFVYDKESGAFGPAKFVGYRRMSFTDYELAVNGDWTGAQFDGNLTQTTITRVLSSPFSPDAQLKRKLSQWADALLDPGVLNGVDSSKWVIVLLSLPGGRPRLRTKGWSSGA